MYGSFSRESLQILDELYNYTVCQRPDGSRYGSNGKCRKGVEVQPEPSARENRRNAIRAALREAPELSSDPNYSGGGGEALAALKRDYTLLRSIVLKKGSFFNRPENVARLLSFRAEIKRLQVESSAQTFLLDPKKYQSALRKSPKYDKTPGSRGPIRKSSGSEYQSLFEIQSRIFRQMGETPSKAEKLKLSKELLDVTRRLESGTGGRTRSPGLADLFKEQGFNAKPELVGTVADLRSRRDLLLNSDGSPMVLHRGVSTAAFANQFRGLGKDGDTHFPGRGIFGRGSYAATANPNGPGTEIRAINLARDYAGLEKGVGRRVVAFAIRSDANVVDFPAGPNEVRARQFREWGSRTLREAEEKTGYEFDDVGEAAAALGIHAFRVPQNYPSEDYFVILNRGAIVAAMDSGLSD